MTLSEHGSWVDYSDEDPLAVLKVLIDVADAGARDENMLQRMIILPYDLKLWQEEVDVQVQCQITDEI